MKTDMNPSFPVMCRAIRALGPDIGGIGRMPAPLAHHASSCLRCQAEVIRYRRLRRELVALADRVNSAPPTLLTNVAHAVQGESAHQVPPPRRTRVVAQIAGATAAAASLAAVAMWRRTRAAA